MAEQKSDVRFVTARATVRQMDEAEAPDVVLAKAMQTAAWMPMVTGGEPTKLLVTAWLAHEGVNANRLAFRAEDLAAAAERIAPPNVLPMDWNHSAVVPQYDLPKAIGVWYAAEAKWNPEAKDGLGAQGIEARGVVWAWAFPEMANEMLAMQQARGYVEFSMACIPTQTESARDGLGSYEIAIDPVFFTLSALNVSPADADAKGSVTMSTETVDATVARLLAAAVVEQVKCLAEGSRGLDHMRSVLQEAKECVKAQRAAQIKEETMDEKQNEMAQAALEAAMEANAVLKAELEKLTEAHAAAVAELTSQLEAATARAEQAELKGEALSAELAAAVEAAAGMKLELETAQAKLAEIAAEQAKVEQAARWAERFAELPESYRAAFAKRSEEEQARFVERWTASSDEVWSEFKSDLLVGFADIKVSYLKLSEEEGKLPTGGEAVDLGGRVSSLIK